MLKVENLKTGFSNKPVLDDVSFEIKKPGLVGLIGPNGCGKSTLLKSIAGVQPFDGTIHFAGRSLKSYPQSQRVHALSYVAQKSGQRVTLTVREVVQLGRDAGRMPFSPPQPDDAEIVDRALFHCSLEDISDMRLHELSGGQIQRVMVARAMAQQANIMLLDEPTNHLDLHHQHKLMDLLFHLAKEHDIAVVLAIHDLALAARYCDRLLLLHNHKLQADGPPKEVLTTEMLSTVFEVKGQLEYTADEIPFLLVKHPIDHRNF